MHTEWSNISKLDWNKYKGSVLPKLNAIIFILYWFFFIWKAENYSISCHYLSKYKFSLWKTLLKWKILLHKCSIIPLKIGKFLNCQNMNSSHMSAIFKRVILFYIILFFYLFIFYFLLYYIFCRKTLLFCWKLVKFETNSQNMNFLQSWYFLMHEFLI